MHFWQEYFGSGVLFSVHLLRRHVMSVYLITGAANFNHLVTVLFLFSPL